MLTIWKWGLEIADRQTIEAPVDAQFLTVQMQRGAPQIWAVVDIDNRIENHQLIMVGTGNPMPADAGGYIGTFQLAQGELVFHVFTSAGR